ncbi:MAG: T9SS type A sorting domain-containing protein, partial [Bacteroidota bacterium]
DVNGCVNSKNVTIIVRPAVSVSAGPDRIPCGSPVILNATASAGSTFTWDNGQTGPSITVNPASTRNYIVTVTDVNGCTGLDTVTVHVPTLFTGGNRNICRGGSTTISASLANYPGNSTGLTYQWSPSTGLSNQVSSNPSASPSQTTLYTVRITDTQSNCVFTGTVVVVVLPTPSVDLGADLVIAPGVAVNLGASVTQVSAATTYTWSMIGTQIGILNPSGNSAQAIFTGNNLSSVQVQQIVLIASNANGCSGSDTISITLDPNLAGKNVYGNVLYSNTSQSVINSGNVTLVSPTGSVRTTSISPGGSYLFTGVLDSTYTLETVVSKAPGGITIADAQLINDHATTPFLTGINLKAADVTGDAIILSNDAQQTARRAANLPLSNSFDQNGPGNWVNDSTSVTVSGSHISRNLIALSYGDVNSSYTPIARTATNLLLTQRGAISPNNDEINLPLYAESTYEFGSIQFEFEIPSGFQLKGVSSSVVSNLIFNQIDNKGVVVWFKHGENGLKVNNGSLIMSLLFQRNPESSSFEDFIVNPIGYQEFNDVNAAAISNVRIYSPKVRLSGKQTLELHPNPTNDRTTLTIQLEKSNEIHADLFDLNGRLVQNLLNSKLLPSGITTIDFDTKDLPKGTYLVKVISTTEPTISTNRRLVVVH